MTLRETINADARRGKATKPTGPTWPTKRLGEGDGLSTKPTDHAPTGPATTDLLAWARQRRREREAGER